MSKMAAQGLASSQSGIFGGYHHGDTTVVAMFLATCALEPMAKREHRCAANRRAACCDLDFLGRHRCVCVYVCVCVCGVCVCFVCVVCVSVAALFWSLRKKSCEDAQADRQREHRCIERARSRKSPHCAKVLCRGAGRPLAGAPLRRASAVALFVRPPVKGFLPRRRHRVPGNPGGCNYVRRKFVIKVILRARRL